MQLVINSIHGDGPVTLTGSTDELLDQLNYVIDADEFLEVQACYDELIGKLDDSKGLTHVIEWFNSYSGRTGIVADLQS